MTGSLFNKTPLISPFFSFFFLFFFLFFQIDLGNRDRYMEAV